jgi:hypothetical protein
LLPEARRLLRSTAQRAAACATLRAVQLLDARAARVALSAAAPDGGRSRRRAAPRCVSRRLRACCRRLRGTAR